MEYIKLYENASEFDELNSVYPSVNLIKDINSLYMECTPSPINYMEMKYNVTQTSGETQILGVNYTGITEIDKMYIDDIEVTPCSGYTFSSLGEHKVRCEFKPYQFKTIRCMFQGNDALTHLDFSNLDTSKVNHFGGTFNYCVNLEEIILGDKFTTRNVTSFSMAFCNCRKLKSLDTSKWKTPKLTNTKRMFDYALALTELDFSNFDMSNVTDYSKMFYSVNKNFKLHINCDNKDMWTNILVTNQSTSNYPTTATYGSDGINLCS